MRDSLRLEVLERRLLTVSNSIVLQLSSNYLSYYQNYFILGLNNDDVILSIAMLKMTSSLYKPSIILGLNKDGVISSNWKTTVRQLLNYLQLKDVSPRLPLDTSRLPRLTAKWKFVPTRDKRQAIHQKEDDAETRSDD
jgi:hypothetical protein